MNFITCVFIGYLVAFTGSITPSFLNLTVVKFSLRSGVKPALFLIGGFATGLFFQANIGAYLSSILIENSQYIQVIQIIGTVILFLLSLNFFRIHFREKKIIKTKDIEKSKAYLYGIGMSLLNTFAIPFYFTTISFLIGLEFFEYSVTNAFYFSIGSTLGSFSLYSIYAFVAKRIEHRLTKVALKMDLILGCLTGVVAIANTVFLVYKGIV